MTKSGKILYNSILISATLSLISLVYLMIALAIFKEQIFMEREIISLADISVAVGFGLFVVFNIVSIFWLLVRFREAEKAAIRKKVILALGAFCLLLLAGEKTMADEIGREYLLGWETFGEWVILYILLAVQLLYSVIILKTIKGRLRTGPALNKLIEEIG